MVAPLGLTWRGFGLLKVVRGRLKRDKRLRSRLNREKRRRQFEVRQTQTRTWIRAFAYLGGLETTLAASPADLAVAIRKIGPAETSWKSFAGTTEPGEHIEKILRSPRKQWLENEPQTAAKLRPIEVLNTALERDFARVAKGHQSELFNSLS